MNFKKMVAGALIAQGIAMLGLSGANASVILTYTGNEFTFFVGQYTGTDKVTATITLASPLGDSLVFTPVTPVSFSVSDGVQTFFTNEFGILLVSEFAFSTDASGAIDGWDIYLEFGLLHPNFIQTRNSGGTAGDLGSMDVDGEGFNQNSPGVWTTPEPSTVSVLGAGLLGLVFIWRRRRQILDLAQ